MCVCVCVMAGMNKLSKVVNKFLESSLKYNGITSFANIWLVFFFPKSTFPDFQVSFLYGIQWETMWLIFTLVKVPSLQTVLANKEGRQWSPILWQIKGMSILLF